MQIVGFNYTKISAEKFSQIIKKGLINNHIEFTNLETEKVEMLKEKNVIKISFNFKITYSQKEQENPDAIIEFRGTVSITLPEKELKELKKKWDKDKKLPQSLQMPLYNFLLMKCTPKSCFLEDEIGLPPHIQVPQVKPHQTQNQDA